jgi:hypothetical protein
MGPGVAVAIIDAMAPVPGKLPNNSAAVPIHLPGDFGRIKALL